MKSTTHKTDGFTALISVILLGTGSLAFSLSALAAASAYADAVNRHEMRIEAGLDAASCLQTAELMAAKDYFLAGNVGIGAFHCTASVTNNLHGHYSIRADVAIGDIRWCEYGDIYLPQP